MKIFKIIAVIVATACVVFGIIKAVKDKEER